MVLRFDVRIDQGGEALGIRPLDHQPADADSAAGSRVDVDDTPVETDVALGHFTSCPRFTRFLGVQERPHF